MIELIFKYLKQYKVMFSLGSIAKLIEAILELWLPILMARIVDASINGASQEYIFEVGYQLLSLVIMGFLFAIVCQYFAAVSSQGIGFNIRKALYEKISDFSYIELDKFNTSTLMNRVIVDVTNIQQVVAFTVRLVSRAPFLCIGSVIMAFNIDAYLSLIFVFIILVLSVILFLFMKVTSKLYIKVQRYLDKVVLIVNENLSGVRVIRAFAKKDDEKKRFDVAVNELNDSNIYVARIAALLNPITTIIVNVAIIMIIYFGASIVNQGRLTQGNILALSTYATKILYSLIIVANLVNMFTKGVASAKRINEVLETDVSISYPKHSEEKNVSSNIILEFKDVCFGYGNETNLKNISFKVERNSTLGIVGVTGSGKTTLINLLQRFYDVDSGKIIIDGIDVKNYSKDDLRKKIAYVLQNNTMFHGSIAENIRIAKADATVDEVITALKIACAYEFVNRLPQSIETVVEEGGKNFSGGQKQRLAIARAVVKHADILILDDSLSALDYKTDLNLRNNFKNELKDTTKIIVSQRISSVVSADLIIVLDDGKIIARGTHENLLNECLLYKQIFEIQQEVG